MVLPVAVADARSEGHLDSVHLGGRGTKQLENRHPIQRLFPIPINSSQLAPLKAVVVDADVSDLGDPGGAKEMEKPPCRRCVRADVDALQQNRRCLVVDLPRRAEQAQALGGVVGPHVELPVEVDGVAVVEGMAIDLISNLSRQVEEGRMRARARGSAQDGSTQRRGLVGKNGFRRRHAGGCCEVKEGRKIAEAESEA
jgi:hypothetical protein